METVKTTFEVTRYTTPLVILKKQPDVNGECVIYLELMVRYKQRLATGQTLVKRTRKRFNTGVKVFPGNWSATKGHVKNDLQHKNRIISKYKSDFDTKIQSLIDGEKVDLKGDLKILETYFANGKAKSAAKQKGLVSYFDDYIKYRKGSGTPRGTLKEFLTCKNRLEFYDTERQITTTFDQINLTYSDNFIKHLSGRNYNPNTIKKTFVILKTVLNHFYARKEELNIELTDKFKDREFGQVSEHLSDPIPLNDIEIELVQDADIDELKAEAIKKFEKDFKKETDQYKRSFYLSNLNKKFDAMRDNKTRVLLQLSTGLRVSDLFKIKPTHVKNDMIVINPAKTQTTKEDNKVYIPLNKISRPILKELKYDSSKLKISSQKYNVGIKELMEAIGLDDEIEIFVYKGIGKPTVEILPKYKVLTSHNMRDTFISKGIRENVPIPILLKATGQSSYEVMKRYIKLENQDMIKHLSGLF